MLEASVDPAVLFGRQRCNAAAVPREPCQHDLARARRVARAGEPRRRAGTGGLQVAGGGFGIRRATREPRREARRDVIERIVVRGGDVERTGGEQGVAHAADRRVGEVVEQLHAGVRALPQPGTVFDGTLALDELVEHRVARQRLHREARGRIARLPRGRANRCVARVDGDGVPASSPWNSPSCHWRASSHNGSWRRASRPGVGSPETDCGSSRTKPGRLECGGQHLQRRRQRPHAYHRLAVAHGFDSLT